MHFEAGTSEAQAYYAHVVSQDNHGNQTIQTVGPSYVDAPTTPDIISDLTYHDWTNSGAWLISSDYALSDTVKGGQLQNFYTSWDNNALRMAWTGGDWNKDGDLFVYLDTQGGGGAAAAYNPFGTPGSIALPPTFGADRLVWV